MNKYLTISLIIAITVCGCIQLNPVQDNITKAENSANLRDYSLALEYLDKAAKMEPNNLEIQLKIASIYRRMEQNKEAIAKLNQIIEKSPDYYEAYYELWATLLETSENEQVKSIIKSQIKAKLDILLNQPNPSDKLYSIAFMIFIEMEDFERADQIKKLLLGKYPDSPEIDDVGQESFEYILMVASELKKRTPLVEAFIKEFPQHKMTDVAYRIVLSYYWKEAKNEEKVKELCNQWVKTHSTDTYAFYLSSRLYAEMDIDLSQAINWANECIRLIKSDTSPKPFWHDEWQYRDAVHLYEAYDALGWAYFKNKDYEKAEKYLNRGISLFGFHSQLLYHLAKVYKDTNRYTEALNAFTQSLISRNDIPEVTDALKETLTQIIPSKDKEIYDKLLNNLYQVFASKEGIPYFVDVTKESGLGKATGSRISWGDYDNDGFQDLLIDGCRLWHNKGHASGRSAVADNGTFEEITLTTGITGTYTGGVWADYNNDGWVDFLSIGADNALWHNNGNGTFTDVTKKMGFTHPESATEGTAWGDYNRDGFVDLYWANDEKEDLPFGRATPHILLQNRGGKSFKNVSVDAGIISEEPMCGRGVSWGDYNNDGWLDIFVTNYRLDPNFLWRNNGNGTFTNVAREVGVEGVEKNGCFGHSIGADWGDYNNDGNLDLFVANLAHPRYITFSNMSYLFQNQGTPDYHFVDFRQPAGIRYEETHSNPAWCDYDNDGLLDLYITSVYVNKPSFLYKQDKNHRFNDVTWLTGTRVTNGWGCAWADFNNDGAMDLIVCGNDNRIYLFRNDVTKLMPNRHWLEVKLIGKDCNKSAIGTRITVQASAKGGSAFGGGSLMREVQGGTGTTCQNSLVQHFGLGEFSEALSVSIRWPCGKTQNLTIKPDQIVTIQEE